MKIDNDLKKFIEKNANLKQAIKLDWWELFNKKKLNIFIDEFKKGKTFRAAYEIAEKA